MKEFTPRAIKLLGNIRRRDIDIIKQSLISNDESENEKLKKDRENFRNISNENKELLNFLTYFRDFFERKDLEEIIKKISDIPKEDIETFQKFYDIDRTNGDDPPYDFSTNTTYLIHKYSEEELEFLASLNDDDLDMFEDEYEDFVDDEDLFTGEDDYEYYTMSQVADFARCDDIDYYDTEYYSDSYEDDGNPEFWHEVPDEEDDDDEVEEDDEEDFSKEFNVHEFLDDDEREELEEAEKIPITFDEDSPQMTDRQLSEFRRMDEKINIYDYSSYDNLEKEGSFKSFFKHFIFFIICLVVLVGLYFLTK